MSKDVQILLKEFRTDADHCGLTSAAEIIRETRNSIVVVPAAAPDTVLKIIKPTGDPNGHRPVDECEVMSRVKRFNTDAVVTPDPLACGRNPEHVYMTRIGNPVSWATNSVEENHRIGLKVGNFAAILYDEMGAIHDDLAPGNHRQFPDGRIGIIDIASIVPSRRPVEMLMTAIFAPPGYATGVAEGFMAASTAKLDLFWFEATLVAKIPRIMYSLSPKRKATSMARVQAGMAHWRQWTESRGRQTAVPSP